VAIIALLISILLPVLGNARAQARAAVCASRISQLAKALLIYSDDFSETPPFLGLGWSDIPALNDVTDTAPGDIPTKTDAEWAVAEDWLSINFDLMWNETEDNWPNKAGPRYGSLYSYTRFENLYVCPDFQRIANKSQNQFNYTRTVLGRKWILGGDYGKLANGGVDEPEYWGNSDFGAPGPVVRSSQVYAPARLNMLFDEWWHRHVGSDPSEHIGFGRNSDIGGGWSAIDCMFFAFADEQGQYHGSDTPGSFAADTSMIKRGTCAYYDGHAGLYRDPLPGRSEMDIGQLLIIHGADFIAWLSEHIFNQRGRSLL
jgi:hypothetical protein